MCILGLGEAESGLWWLRELCTGASFGASCDASCGASGGASCSLSIFGLWEAKSGLLGLLELCVGASCGFGSFVMEVWLEYFQPGGG